MNTWYIQILIAIIPGILISFLTAFLTVRLSFKKFRHERWWDRKADLYSNILDSLHQRIKYLENESDVYCSEYCDNSLTNEMKNKTNELYKKYSESLDHIARVRDIGSFIISKEAIEELNKGLNSGLTEKDWREMYPPDFYKKELDTVNNCLQRIIIIAKKDLEIK
ncbi:MAG TPA: hypothetical protein ACFYD7_01370 [Candidatus Wujingus californicus]|uniref:hypothetical protein n=1 Tax=Candidatus Wujingus californicus TaxID=3367618 RepID=UPI001DCD5C31|nr:hypothetical protein [Planctomycetota bacterium]MDO8131022.1 hypothetical protein [Candidatus Brocadiales bacterium]